MPELPEVETVVRGLSAHIIGCKITSVTVNEVKFRKKIPSSFAADITGSTIQGISRRAKYILIDIGGYLICHLGMSGRLTITDQYEPQKHDHVLIELDNGLLVVFNDARRFGFIEYVPTLESLAHLGVEPLSDAFTPEYMQEKSKGKSLEIKKFIMDQRIVVGVGNIYACEALFQSLINPEKKSFDLTHDEWCNLILAIKKTLKKAIESGGTTLKDYRTHDSKLGYFQQRLYVYGRSGLPCMECGNEISRIVQGGRSTFFCSFCQE